MLLYGTFIDHSTHLGNLFVAIGNTELNNKMVSYMTDQKVFITTPYYSGGPFVAVDRVFCWVLHSQETPSIKLLHSSKKQEVSVINM